MFAKGIQFARLELWKFEVINLRRGPEPYRHQLRDARLLHGHAVQHWSDAHRLLAVGDKHELCLHAHLFD